MSKWTVTFEMDDKNRVRCKVCPLCQRDENCKLQPKDFSSFAFQLENCPLKEVVE